jgi:hypothetical protein
MSSWVFTSRHWATIYALAWFINLGVNCALAASEAHNTMGSWVWLIHPFAQSICG